MRRNRIIVLLIGVALFCSCQTEDLTNLGVLYSERIKQLKDYPEYKDDGISIPFTYDLNRRDLYESIIKEYKLDEITAGYSDVDLMIVLLNWVCNNFKHDGKSAFPILNDSITIMKFSKASPNGINCRLLAIMLAELCRLYGIEAKHISGFPKEGFGRYVHVVTQAYSKKYDQWILLDPTYRLYLKNAKGDYLNLASLRESVINGEEIYANANAGHNGRRFNMYSYKRFMIDFLFCFTCTTDYSFGSDGRENLLVPVDFFDVREKVTTTSANVFWATP